MRALTFSTSRCKCCQASSGVSCSSDAKRSTYIQRGEVVTSSQRAVKGIRGEAPPMRPTVCTTFARKRKDAREAAENGPSQSTWYHRTNVHASIGHFAAQAAGLRNEKSPATCGVVTTSSSHSTRSWICHTSLKARAHAAHQTSEAGKNDRPF